MPHCEPPLLEKCEFVPFLNVLSVVDGKEIPRIFTRSNAKAGQSINRCTETPPSLHLLHLAVSQRPIRFIYWLS